MMRKGKETEEWDRFSFLIANVASIAGAKDVKADDFHKYRMQYKGLTQSNMKDLKQHFAK